MLFETVKPDQVHKWVKANASNNVDLQKITYYGKSPAWLFEKVRHHHFSTYTLCCGTHIFIHFFVQVSLSVCKLLGAELSRVDQLDQ